MSESDSHDYVVEIKYRDNWDILRGPFPYTREGGDEAEAAYDEQYERFRESDAQVRFVERSLDDEGVPINRTVILP